MEIELQWLIIALIMVEKSRHGTKSVDHSLPPRYEEKLPPPPTATAAKSPPKAENSNNSALANALRCVPYCAIFYCHIVVRNCCDTLYCKLEAKLSLHLTFNLRSFSSLFLVNL